MGGHVGGSGGSWQIRERPVSSPAAVAGDCSSAGKVHSEPAASAKSRASESFWPEVKAALLGTCSELLRFRRSNVYIPLKDAVAIL